MKISVAVIFSLLMTIGLQTASASASPPSAVVTKTQSIVRDAAISGMAIVKVDDGKINWTHQLGIRSEDQNIGSQTIFNAASLTKPVFAMLVLRLVAEGHLELDEPLAEYWIDPDIADDPRHKALTARIVLSHQTGLPNWRGKNELSFLFSPGSRHEYSGEGFEYLRRAIEKKLGMNISDLTKKYVFDPAAMASSSMGSRSSHLDNIAKGFNENLAQIETGITQRSANAAANLMTTAEDYARFLIWVADGANLPENLYKEMSSPQSLHQDPAERFGLGWKLIPLESGEALFHDGRERGVRTFAVIEPSGKEGLVILTNSSNGDLAYRTVSSAALSYAAAFWQSTDRLVWTYFNSLPGQALRPMSKAIARSPAFLQTFLHAAITNLIVPSELPDNDKQLAEQAVKPLVLKLLNGALDPSQTEELITSLFAEKNGNLTLVSTLDKSEAAAWVRKLKQHM